jgi:hypothetical protein
MPKCLCFYSQNTCSLLLLLEIKRTIYLIYICKRRKRKEKKCEREAKGKEKK